MAAKKKKPVKQAMRFNADKPQLAYILDFPRAIHAFSDVCQQGAEKYARHNWKAGFPVTELEDSLLRHLEKFHNCEDHDAESKQLHMGHVMWNAMAIIETLGRHEAKFDNRDFKNEGAKS